jgi:toxin ParE1/3/4
MAKFRLIVIGRARADIKEIQRYTLEKWGEKQMLAYGGMIDAALHSIEENPLLGNIRDDLMMYPVAKHCIYYRVYKTTIYVLRILHARMDAIKHLPQ